MDDQKIASESANAKSHLERAYAFEENDAFDEALRECDLYLRLDPYRADAHNLRGIVLEDLERKEQALAAYREAVRLNPEYPEAQENLKELVSELANAHSARGDHLYQQDKIIQAQKEWREATRLDPNHLIAHYNLAISFLRNEQLDQAESEFRVVLRIDPDDPDAHRGLGQVFDKRQDWKDAIHEYYKVLSIGPRDDETRRVLIGDLIEVDNVEEAETELNKLQHRMPSSDADLWARLGKHFDDRGARSDAARAFKAALILNPDLSNIRARLECIAPDGLRDIPPASAPVPLWTPHVIFWTTFFLGAPVSIVLAGINWIRMGMVKKALAYMMAGWGLTLAYFSLVIALPIQAHSPMGDAYWLLGFTGNVAALTRLHLETRRDIAAFSANRAVRNANLLGGCLIGLGVWSLFSLGALMIRVIPALFLIASSWAPSAPTAADYYNRGIAFSDKDDYDQAIANYTKAIELQPDFPAAYNNRGDVLRKKGDYDRAIADLDKAIELAPKLAAPYHNRGLTYQERGNDKQAIADYSKAIELGTRFAETYFDRAVLQKEDLDQAIADYTKAIEFDPRYHEAYNNRGFLYTQKGNFEQAITDLSRAIELNPRSVHSYYNRGVAYGKKGEYDHAITDFNQAIALDPQPAILYYVRGLAYLRKGVESQALSDFETYLRLAPNASNRAQVEESLRGLR